MKNKQVRDLARKVIITSMGIGTKPNPWLKKAPRALKPLLRKKKFPYNKRWKSFEDPLKGPLLVRKGNYYYPKKTVGHCVKINYNAHNAELAEEMRRICLKRGAHVMMSELSVRKSREAYLLSPVDSVRELTPLAAAIASNLDYVVTIEPLEKEFWKKGIPPSKFMAAAPASQKLYSIRDKHNVRWVYVGWPIPGVAKDLHFPPAKFKKILMESLKWSYKPQMIDLINSYYNALKGSKTIRIVHRDGTDLTFSVRGRRFLRDDGILDENDIKNNDVGMNIPCGEVFTAPVENSANGVLKIPKNIVGGHGLAHGITFVFKNGKIVKYSAKKNKKYLDAFFKQNTGKIKTIAELGIGCNPGADFTNGYILVDEKIFKTIHIAIGWNIGYGGKNKASAHQDFIKPMVGGEMYADGKLVMKDGEFVHARKTRKTR